MDLQDSNRLYTNRIAWRGPIRDCDLIDAAFTQVDAAFFAAMKGGLVADKARRKSRLPLGSPDFSEMPIQSGSVKQKAGSSSFLPSFTNLFLNKEVLLMRKRSVGRAALFILVAFTLSARSLLIQAGYLERSPVEAWELPIQVTFLMLLSLNVAGQTLKVAGDTVIFVDNWLADRLRDLLRCLGKGVRIIGVGFARAGRWIARRDDV